MLRGLTFSKQFPNPAEPFRGLFVAEQVKATAAAVEWSVIAPVPWVPRALAGPMGKAYVRGDGVLDGVSVVRPRYPVLPRRALYTTVATAMAHASRRPFERALRAGGTQFVHAHALYPSGAAAARLVGGAGVPLIVTVHGSDLYSNLVKRSWRSAVAGVADAASAIICVGRDLAIDCVRELGADPGRITVIPNTYDAEHFRFAERESNRGGPLRLVTVGRLVDIKGHDDLVNAVGLLVGEGRDVTCRIIGSGPERDRLEHSIAERGLVDRVLLTGALPAPRIAAELRDADVFVLPSHREGFGVVLIEAMSTGLPVVATRSGGPTEIVHAEDGILVAPRDHAALADGIRAVADTLPSFDRRSISQRVQERYGARSVADRLVRVYSAVVERRPLPSDLAFAPEGHLR